MRALQRVGIIVAVVVACGMAAVFAAQSTSQFKSAKKSAYPGEFLDAAQAKLRATYTQFQFDEIRQSEIPGVVEIYAGPRILYYAPEQDILILGEYYASNGTSITQQKIAQMAARKVEDLDRSTALQVGTGKTELIAFIDPDCHYCRLAYQWLAEQKFPGIKQSIFFTSMHGRTQARARAVRALCAPPDKQADALSHLFDANATDAALAPVECEGVDARLAAHAENAAKLGVYATPFFIVQGQVVAGFDRDRLASLLGSGNQTGETR